MKKFLKKSIKDSNGITLIALVITIIVLLILAGISISMLSGDNNILKMADKAKEKTNIEQVKEQIELEVLGSYENGILDPIKTKENILKNIQGATVEENSFPLTVEISNSKDVFMINTDGSVEVNNKKYAMFDKGTVVAEKMWNLASDGISIVNGQPMSNMSINAIKQYNGNLTQEELDARHAVDVSWIDGYTMYKQNPDSFGGKLPENIELSPIYMWFEKEENKELRSPVGSTTLPLLQDTNREVDVGTIYFWSDSKRIYLNNDSSYMFAMLPYLSNISGLKYLKTENVTNMSNILFTTCWGGKNHFKDLDDLSSWDVSNVTNLSAAFLGNSLLTNVNGLSNWDVGNVKDMSELFDDCCNLTNISGLKNWNTSNVENMKGLFSGMDNGTMALKDITSLKNWNVQKVKNMSDMFLMCHIQDASPINDWDITNVDVNGGGFSCMFKGEQSHPEFSKRNGTWDEDGTFIPES